MPWFRLRSPKTPTRHLENGCKTHQEAPKTRQDAPRYAKDAPKTRQDGPKTAPRRSQGDTKTRQKGGNYDTCVPTCAEDARGAPKTPPRRPQDDPNMSQDAPRKLPERKEKGQKRREKREARRQKREETRRQTARQTGKWKHINALPVPLQRQVYVGALLAPKTRLRRLKTFLRRS